MSHLCFMISALRWTNLFKRNAYYYQSRFYAPAIPLKLAASLLTSKHDLLVRYSIIGNWIDYCGEHSKLIAQRYVPKKKLLRKVSNKTQVEKLV